MITGNDNNSRELLTNLEKCVSTEVSQNDAVKACLSNCVMQKITKCKSSPNVEECLVAETNNSETKERLANCIEQPYLKCTGGANKPSEQAVHNPVVFSNIEKQYEHPFVQTHLSIAPPTTNGTSTVPSSSSIAVNMNPILLLGNNTDRNESVDKCATQNADNHIKWIDDTKPTPNINLIITPKSTTQTTQAQEKPRQKIVWINETCNTDALAPDIAGSCCGINDFDLKIHEHDNKMTFKELTGYIDRLVKCKFLERKMLGNFIETLTTLDETFTSLLTRDEGLSASELCKFVALPDLFDQLKFVSNYLNAINMICIIDTLDDVIIDHIRLYYKHTDTVQKMTLIMSVIEKHAHKIANLCVTINSTLKVAAKLCDIKKEMMVLIKNIHSKLMNSVALLEKQKPKYHHHEICNNQYSGDILFIIIAVGATFFMFYKLLARVP